jgi:cytochrome c556
VSLKLLSLSVRPQLVCVALSIALLAGCGGSKHSQAAPRPVTTRTAAAKVRTPQVRALIRDYKTLGADVAAMRAAASRVHGQTLKGTPALRGTTGRFIEDLEKSHLTLKARNRMIDHAAGAVSTSCDQCFQQLEAVRPIPQIAHPH